MELNLNSLTELSDSKIQEIDDFIKKEILQEDCEINEPWRFDGDPDIIIDFEYNKFDGKLSYRDQIGVEKIISEGNLTFRHETSDSQNVSSEKIFQRNSDGAHKYIPDDWHSISSSNSCHADQMDTTNQETENICPASTYNDTDIKANYKIDDFCNNQLQSGESPVCLYNTKKDTNVVKKHKKSHELHPIESVSPNDMQSPSLNSTSINKANFSINMINNKNTFNGCALLRNHQQRMEKNFTSYKAEVLLENLKTLSIRIKEIIWPHTDRNKMEFFEQLNLHTMDLLFFGPQGCGKKFIAEMIANVLETEFITIETHEFQLDKRIQKILSDVEKYPKIILYFDNIESILENSARSIEFFDMLTELERNKKIIKFAATSYLQIISKVLEIQKFHKLVYISFPSEKYRKEIFKTKLKEFNLDEGTNVDKWAKDTVGYSIADINNLCENIIKEAHSACIKSHCKVKYSSLNIKNHYQKVFLFKPKVLPKNDLYRAFETHLQEYKMTVYASIENLQYRKNEVEIEDMSEQDFLLIMNRQMHNCLVHAKNDLQTQRKNIADLKKREKASANNQLLLQSTLNDKLKSGHRLCKNMRESILQLLECSENLEKKLERSRLRRSSRI